jgi:polar amino acid transport system substrate-binding protein
MTPVRGRPRYAIVAGAVLFALTIASACGSEKVDDGAAPAAAFDQALHDRLPAAIVKRGTVRVGGSDPYPPAAFYAPDGRTVVGFEPDLAAELGRVLGVRLEFVNLSFSDLLPQLRRHKFDLAMASITDNAEREKQADFVNYFQAGTAIIVQRGNPQGISDLKDLCGRVVAVAEDTVQVDLLRRTQKGCDAGEQIHIRPYGDNANALVQLRTGRAVAVLSDYPPAVQLSTDQRTSAVAKDQTELRDVLRDALEHVMRSGGYADVLRRWGVPSGALEAATINAGGGTTAG